MFSALVDTDFVLGVDCDGSALEQAQLNVQQLEMEDRISLIQAKVDVPLPRDGTTQPSSRGGRGGGRMKGRGERGRGRVKHQPQAQPQQRAALPNEEDADRQDDRLSFPLLDNCVDTVVTNPPFGTKPDKAGIDVQFLKLGCRLARRAVYSFHKSSTRDFILRTASVLPNVVSAAVIAEMKFDLPRTYKFHQQASVDVEVDLIRVELIHAVNSDSSGGKADKNSSISSDEDYGTFTEG